jgi:hypothetical protein
MVRYPLGGNLSWALQWLVGLQALGHEVYFVEKAGYENACFDPARRRMSDDCTYGVKVVSSLLKRWELNDKFCFADAKGTYYGIDRRGIEEIFSSADLFIDMGTHGTWLPEAAACKRVLIELEPAYTQMKMQNALDAGLTGATYDAYYTNGLNIGTPASSAPTGGVCWHHVCNPVVSELFDNTVAPPDGAAFTTVMNWQAHDPIEFRGISFGQKDVEFEKFERLPSLVKVPMEVAVSGERVPALAENGWRIRNAHEVTATVRSYWNYIVTSIGEFGVCKNVFVTTNSGWFSDRSAAYLASGRPVVIQATGFEEHLPCGLGLFAVRNAAEAAEVIRAILGDYKLHSAAARQIALEHLDAKLVLGRFLHELSI